MHLDECLLYESGELAGVEAAKFERHLSGCAECRETLASAEAAHRWSSAAVIEPQPRLKAAVLAAAGGFSAQGRAAAAVYALAGLLLALTLARGLDPADSREELERLGAEIAQLKEYSHE